MTPEQITEAAQRLFEADQTGVQVGLLSVQYPQMTMEDAYRVQDALVALKSRGNPQIGWKIGLTSRAMQQALGIETPDSGVLLADMRFENGCVIPPDRFIQPRIEAEIAFVLNRDLAGPDVTAADVRDATDTVAPVLEILDTRILRADPDTGQTRGICDTISDNAANAGIVLGDMRHSVADIDLAWVGAVVRRDGVVEETGLGAGVLGDPLLGVAWLANRLATVGQRIEAGQILLSGSFIRPIEAAGSLIEADFGPFGTVACTFS